MATKSAACSLFSNMCPSVKALDNVKVCFIIEINQPKGVLLHAAYQVLMTSSVQHIDLDL